MELLGHRIEDRVIWQDRAGAIRRLGVMALDTGTAIYAWAQLPNHCHLLLRSGPAGLPGRMRRRLTGYALAFNRRHRRAGHLFQNRYKSIVCDADDYFRELVRYIHLNPLRAGLVSGPGELDRYPWAGHAALLGKTPPPWLGAREVLAWFGKMPSPARRAYRCYVLEGIPLGPRPDLVGGGLIRSLGGWSEVLAVRRHGERVAADPRNLGNGEFVEQLLREADAHHAAGVRARVSASAIADSIRRACIQAGVSLEALQAGSHQGAVSQVRATLAHHLVAERGLPLAEAVRHLGVCTYAVAEAARRAAEEFHPGNNVPQGETGGSPQRWPVMYFSSCSIRKSFSSRLALTMSPMETSPTTRSPSTTGRWRIR